MWREMKSAVPLLAALTLLTGVAYPLAVTMLAQWLFPRQANGSLIERDGVVVGSALVGQPFAGAAYFWPRPSATVPPYDGGASTGSNLGPSNPLLHRRVEAAVTALRREHGDGPVPVDLVTTSASGLDPHVSPAAALYQVARVARARGLTEATVTGLVRGRVEGRWLGLLGEPRVNVLELNLALDALDGAGAGGAR